MKSNQQTQHSIPDIGFGESVFIERNHGLPSQIGMGNGGYLRIKTGAAALFACSEGGLRLFICMVGPGFIFAPEAQLLSAGFTIDVEAEIAIELCIIAKPGDSKLCHCAESLDVIVASQTARLLKIVQFHLIQIKARSSVERTKYALFNYAQCAGVPSACGNVAIKVNRDKLASWIDISNDRLGRIIRDLHNAGELTIKGRSIVIHSQRRELDCYAWV